jgi:nucleotide-binding universal stress UspA family protein
MTYKTLMVHLQIGQSNSAVLDVARVLAETHRAAILGVAVLQKTQSLHEEDNVFFANRIEQSRPLFQAKVEATEAEFQAAVQGITEAEWHFGQTYHTVAEGLAEAARGVDLVIVNANQPMQTPVQSHGFHLAELVALAGRPVLGVPKAPVGVPDFARGMVYWKDTVESRRAVAGALPMLQKASYVSLVQTANESDITAKREQMQLVIQWFERHGVTVDATVLDSGGNDAARLRAFAAEQKPDFAVAGSYSHSRLRERVFGGVTRDMLRNIDRCVLFSQ